MLPIAPLSKRSRTSDTVVLPSRFQGCGIDPGAFRAFDPTAFVRRILSKARSGCARKEGTAKQAKVKCQLLFTSRTETGSQAGNHSASVTALSVGALSAAFVRRGRERRQGGVRGFFCGSLTDPVVCARRPCCRPGLPCGGQSARLSLFFVAVAAVYTPRAILAFSESLPFDPSLPQWSFRITASKDANNCYLFLVTSRVVPPVMPTTVTSVPKGIGSTSSVTASRSQRLPASMTLTLPFPVRPAGTVR